MGRTVICGGSGIYYSPQDGNPLFRLSAGIPGHIAQALTFNAFVPARPPGYDVFGGVVLGPAQIQQAGIDINQKTSQATQWTLGVRVELLRPGQSASAVALDTLFASLQHRAFRGDF